MKTQKRIVHDLLPTNSDPKLLVYCPFYPDNELSVNSNSIMGMFLSDPIETDMLSTGMLGQLAKHEASWYIYGNNNQHSNHKIALTTLCIQHATSEENDINFASYIDIKNLTTDSDEQLQKLINNIADAQGAEGIEHATSVTDFLLCNPHFVPAIFSRLNHLLALKYRSKTKYIDLKTTDVITFRNDNPKITAHGPLGTLTHKFIYV